MLGDCVVHYCMGIERVEAERGEMEEFYGARAEHFQPGSPNYRCARRKASLKRKYGLTPHAYTLLRNGQGGRCACCGDELLGGRDEHVDHCHASGVVRGIVCRCCNSAVGFVKDDPERARMVARYLDR